MGEVTRILSDIERGEPRAAEQLLPLVYDELRKLAALKLVHEKPGQTLDATALVHEAYIRLVGRDFARNWDSRGHFFAAAAEAMRRLLVENARRKQRLKRGRNARRRPLEDFAVSIDGSPEDLLALDDALNKFARLHPARAELVKLRFFAGLTNEQAAHVLGISTSTADRHWTYARAWLFREINGTDGEPAK